MTVKENLEQVRQNIVAAASKAGKKSEDIILEMATKTVDNGTNINREAGALHHNVRAEAVRHGAPLGIALDGDADRVIVVDEKGQIVDGDVVMAMCAQRMLDDGEFRNGAVVATVMSNLGLERALESRGVKLVRTPVGDRYVVEAMRQGGYNLGGEQSGHLVFLDHASTGDGIVGGLQELGLMMRTGRPLSELARGAMERVPRLLENVSLPARRPLEELAELQQALGRVRATLGAEGRVLVRWSGTEPKLRIMVEGPDEALIRDFCHQLATAARRDLVLIDADQACEGGRRDAVVWLRETQLIPRSVRMKSSWRHFDESRCCRTGPRSPVTL